MAHKALHLSAWTPLKPYVHTLMHVWTAPWTNLSHCIENVLQGPAKGTQIQRRKLRAWTEAKKTEFTYVSFAGSLVASVVTGSLQWKSLDNSHWIILASWYGSLIMSIFCIIIAFHLCIFITTYETHGRGKEHLLGMLQGRDPGVPRWLSLYILQIPIVLLSYATISYAVGLSVLVLQPLWSFEWNDESKIAFVFAVFLAFSCSSFVLVVITIYHVYLPQMRRPPGSSRAGEALECSIELEDV